MEKSVQSPASKLWELRSAYKNQFIIDDSSPGIWGTGCGGVCPRGGGVRLAQYKNFGMVLGMVFCLWRPGGAFFQIGLGCVMSHHQSPHRMALHIPVLILAGKFKMEFLPTVSH